MSSIQTDARFWDGIARKYARDRIADEAGYERTLKRTREYLKPTDRALEFGCGTGTTALRLAPSVETLIATDISAEMIAIAKEKQASGEGQNVDFVQSALERISYDDASFDVVLGFNALHLVRDLKDSLWRVRRLVKPGGLFISKTACLGDMNALLRVAIPVMQMFGKAPAVAVFTAKQLEAAVAAAGFDVVEVARHASKGKDARPFIVARARL